MIDDHKYSLGRTVVFRLAGEESKRKAGRWAGKSSGTVVSIRSEDSPEPHWVYTIEKQRTKHRVEVNEEDVLYGVTGKRSKTEEHQPPVDDSRRIEAVAESLDRMFSESALSNFLRNAVKDLVRREVSEEVARREGRELPLQEGDYIRIRGDLREELEPFHNYYGKIIRVLDPDIAGLEARPDRKGEVRTYRVIRKYEVILDDGHLVEIYDPEIKLYYTSGGKSTILNWRAATFLAEAFDDPPPYRVEFSYLEDHIFTRDELAGLDQEQLVDLLSSILYVKGHMGWRDFQQQRAAFAGLSVAYLVDSILAASRFDHRRNRPLSREEIEDKRRQTLKFKELLGG